MSYRKLAAVAAAERTIALNSISKVERERDSRRFDCYHGLISSTDLVCGLRRQAREEARVRKYRGGSPLSLSISHGMSAGNFIKRLSGAPVGLLDQPGKSRTIWEGSESWQANVVVVCAPN